MNEVRWSWRIGRVLGIQIRVHVIFVLLLLFVGYSSYVGGGLKAAGGAMLFFLSIFAFVLLHELGHCVAAMRFGVRVIDISLLPIGGLARLSSLPEEPRKEVIIALAGPAVNFVSASALWLVAWVAGVSLSWHAFSLNGDHFLVGLFWVNLLMATFNLVPAFPMDGGRVLRGLLAMRLDYGRATHTAVNVGQTIAVVFSFVGLFYNWWLILIAVFIFMSAAGEERLVRARGSLHGIPASRVMSTEFTVLDASETLRRAAEHCYLGCRGDFPVVRGGRLVGVITRRQLLAGLHEHGMDAPVAEIMEPEAICAAPTTELSEIYSRMAASGIEAVPVVEDGRIVGMLALEDVGRYVLQALAPQKQPEPMRRTSP